MKIILASCLCITLCLGYFAANAKADHGNFQYVTSTKDISGYALQLGAFATLTRAKDFALEVVKNGIAEKRQLFIYSLKVGEMIWYRVYFGMVKNEAEMLSYQKAFQNFGYEPFLKEFK